jgi:hypothetical protein
MTFNILIATVGRPSLQRMLDSLSPQLEEQDCLTIVFDGHSGIPTFNLSKFNCSIQQYFEPVALGSWGHAIRNKYSTLLEKRDFVMHADDDDIYLPDVFGELRKQCVNPETLYIARMRGPNGYIVPEGPRIIEGHIGTPNGIIPYSLNIQGNWLPRFGGDGAFYTQLSKLSKNTEYLQTLIYQIRPSGLQSMPKIIHQIWIGPKKRPDIWMDNVKNFALKYGYEYLLWDDKKVSELKMINRDWYEKEPTFNGKSDILRYEILYQNGGIYIDADMVILNSDKFNTLVNDFKTDAGIGFEIDGKLLCGAVTLAIKNSQFIKKCIDIVPFRDMTKMAWISVGPQLITDMAIKHQKEIPLTLYPSVIFYPVRWHGIQEVDLHTKTIVPPESVMFQYGYSTNNLESKI